MCEPKLIILNGENCIEKQQNHDHRKPRGRDVPLNRPLCLDPNVPLCDFVNKCQAVLTLKAQFAREKQLAKKKRKAAIQHEREQEKQSLQVLPDYHSQELTSTVAEKCIPKNDTSKNSEISKSSNRISPELMELIDPKKEPVTGICLQPQYAPMYTIRDPTGNQNRPIIVNQAYPELAKYIFQLIDTNDAVNAIYGIDFENVDGPDTTEEERQNPYEILMPSVVEDLLNKLISKCPLTQKELEMFALFLNVAKTLRPDDLNLYFRLLKMRGVVLESAIDFLRTRLMKLKPHQVALMQVDHFLKEMQRFIIFGDPEKERREQERISAQFATNLMNALKEANDWANNSSGKNAKAASSRDFKEPVKGDLKSTTNKDYSKGDVKDTLKRDSKNMRDSYKMDPKDALKPDSRGTKADAKDIRDSKDAKSSFKAEPKDMKDSTKADAKDSSKGGTKDSSKEGQKDSSKGSPKDIKDASKADSKDVKDSTKADAKDSSKAVAKDSSKADSKDVKDSKADSRDTKDSLKGGPKDIRDASKAESSSKVDSKDAKSAVPKQGVTQKQSTTDEKLALSAKASKNLDSTKASTGSVPVPVNATKDTKPQTQDDTKSLSGVKGQNLKGTSKTPASNPDKAQPQQSITIKARNEPTDQPRQGSIGYAAEIESINTKSMKTGNEFRTKLASAFSAAEKYADNKLDVQETPSVQALSKRQKAEQKDAPKKPKIFNDSDKLFERYSNANTNTGDHKPGYYEPWNIEWPWEDVEDAIAYMKMLYVKAVPDPVFSFRRGLEYYQGVLIREREAPPPPLEKPEKPEKKNAVKLAK